MIRCPKCSVELDDDAKFCDNCGQQIFKTVFCPNCGEKMSTEDAFCENCGNSLTEDSVKVQPKASQAPATPPVPKQQAKASKSKKKGIPFLIPVAAVLVVAVLCVLVFKVLGGKGTDPYSLYVKDREIWYTDFSKDAWEVTENFMEGAELDLATLTIAGRFLIYSESGSKIIYPNEISKNGEVELFYKNVDDSKQESIRIDSEIVDYVANEDFDRITYLKKGNGENNLYQHNLEKKEKIATGVFYFEASDDGKSVIYKNYDGELYLWEEGKGKEKLASDVSSISGISQDFSTIYYIEKDELYKLQIGEEKEKIASDIFSVPRIYDSDKLFYLKKEIEEVSLMDYVEDDMASSNEKDSLRDSLKDATYELEKYSFCYYDGKEVLKMDNVIWGIHPMDAAKENPVAVMSVYNPEKIEKMPISSINDISEVYTFMENNQYAVAETCVIIEDAKIMLSEEDLNLGYYYVNDAGDALYLLEEIDEDNDGDLYRAKIEGGEVKEFELCDTDVTNGMGMGFLSDDIYIYYKNLNGYSGELFINGKEIDCDVNIGNTTLGADGDSVVYISDGTLKIYENGKSKVISEDVEGYAITMDNNIVYLYDYSDKSDKGTLCLYKNGKTKELAEDVTGIVSREGTFGSLYLGEGMLHQRGYHVSWSRF